MNINELKRVINGEERSSRFVRCLVRDHAFQDGM